MIRLIRIEFDKAFQNAWFGIAVLIGCAIAVASAAVSVKGYFDWSYDVFDPEACYYPLASSGSFAAWIGVRRMDTTFLPDLFFALAPLCAALPYAWSLRSELVSGFINQPYVRTVRMRYLLAKYAATFCSGAATVAMPLLLNFVVLSCFIPGYIPDAGDGMRVLIMPNYAFSGLFFSKPLLYVLVYTLFDAVLCGLWAVFVLSLSFLIDNRVVLMAGSYLGLFLAFYFNETVLPQLTQASLVPELNLISFINPIPTHCADDIGIACVVALISAVISAVLCLVCARRDVL